MGDEEKRALLEETEDGGLERLAELELLLRRYEEALVARGVDPEELGAIRAGKVALGEGRSLSSATAAVRHHLSEPVSDAVKNFSKLAKQIVVRLDHVNFTTMVDTSGPKIKTVANQNPLGAALTKVHAKLKGGGGLKVQHILKDVSGILKPGKITLVIGPPGSGKTSYLRAVAGRLTAKKAKKTRLEGSITFNGEAVGTGRFVPSKVAGFVNQTDSHLPHLSVEDTLKFAFDTVGAAERFTDEELKRAKASAMDVAKMKEVVEEQSKRYAKTTHIMNLLGISHVKKTMVGDAQTRGVSGGQRRRVTFAEMLMARFRIICGDEISTGLDSQTTHDVVKVLCTATQAFSLVSVISLLQPPPEVFDLFDDCVFMLKGRVIFHAPTDRITDYFRSIHYEIPPRKDVADFLIEVVSPLGADYFVGGEKKPAEPWTPAMFVEAYQSQCKRYEQMQVELKTAPPYPIVDKWPAYYEKEFTESLWYYTDLLLRRRLALVRRDPKPVKSTLLQALLVGLFTGIMVLDTPYNEFGTKVGVTFSAMIFIALMGMSNVQGMVKDRDVFYKQRDASFFPTTAYVLSTIAFNMPITIGASCIYANIVFWLAGLASGNYGHFMLVAILLGLAMNNWFGFISGIAPNAQAAGPLGGMSVLMIILFSGFVVQRPNIPQPWRPMYWVSPVAFAFRALVIGEFRSDRYKKCTYQAKFMCKNVPEDEGGACCAARDDGLVFLARYSFQHEKKWIYIGELVLAGYFVFSFFLYVLALTKLRFHSTGPGVADDSADDDIVDDSAPYEPSSATEILNMARKPSTVAQSHGATKDANNNKNNNNNGEIPYEPMMLAFQDMSYTVSSTPQGRHEEPQVLKLLDSVTGYSKPKEMTALMGSSGAGKTTLLDVLAGRKSGGSVEGDITVNGHPKRQRTFLRVSGYVEQLDVHSPGATVLEAVAFSAALRLPGATSAQARDAFTQRILEVLELEDIGDKMVGSLTTGGLTFEQRKRLTMGVELAANPAILFLDEPTSGLDSRAALVVIRGVRAVAESGRSVICTIHQPSYALFAVFDRLLLLKRGGKTVYFGDVGRDCASLVTYLDGTRKALQCESMGGLGEGANPATWMLTACVADDADFAAAYSRSALAAENREATVAAGTPAEGSAPLNFDSVFAVSHPQQAKILIRKMLRTYWRGPSYNVARGMVSIIVAIIFGTVYGAERPNAVNTFSGALGRCGLFFLDAFFMGIIFFSSAIPAFVEERAAFYREHASRMYDVGPYLASFFVAEVPYLIFFSLLHVSILWGFIDFYPGVSKFFFYWGFYFLYVTCMTFFAQFLAAACETAQSAQELGQACLSASTLVSGFIIAPQNIPAYFEFLYWLSPIHYVLEGITVTQFRGADVEITDLPGTPTVEFEFTSHNSDSYFGGWFVYSHRWTNIGVLLGLIALFRVLTLYNLTFTDYATK